MLQLIKIAETDHDTLNMFLKSKKFLPLFDFSPYSLATWFTHKEKSLYIARLEHEEVLILHREKNNDIRFMFFKPTDAMIKAVTEHFDPQYVALNEFISSEPNTAGFATQNEITIDIKAIVEFKDKKLKRSYDRCLRRHPGLKVELYEPRHREAVQIFFREWLQSPSKIGNPFASTANDEHFIELYSNKPEIVGIIVRDNERVVGVSFFGPAIDGEGLGIMCKTLRGYFKLGLFTYIERTKLMASHGYTKSYDGVINSEFKNSLIPSGTIHTTFAREISRKTIFKTHGPYVLKLI